MKISKVELDHSFQRSSTWLTENTDDSKAHLNFIFKVALHWNLKQSQFLASIPWNKMDLISCLKGEDSLKTVWEVNI